MAAGSASATSVNSRHGRAARRERSRRAQAVRHMLPPRHGAGGVPAAGARGLWSWSGRRARGSVLPTTERRRICCAESAVTISRLELQSPMPDSRPRTRFIFVTGGVVSSLGKGIAAASIGRLLVSRGLKVALQKFDPYINVDPGTMSPFQHGEVFVTEDGAETDLDLGHYERFTDANTSRGSNVTAGAV